MWQLIKFLEENERQITDSSDDVLANLVSVLQEIRESKDNHDLAAAIISAMRVGRRAQQIKDAGDKTAEQFFKEAMMQAFEVGKRSAIIRP